MTIEIGNMAPDFSLKSNQNEEVSLSSYRGQKSVILAFFPAAFTGGWAHELTTFRSQYKGFEEADTQVLGISVDSRQSLNQFGSSLGGMPFPLLADFFPHGKVAEMYETLNEESGTARRATFLIDKQGIMRWSKLSGQPDIEELLGLLKEL